MEFVSLFKLPQINTRKNISIKPGVQERSVCYCWSQRSLWSPARHDMKQRFYVVCQIYRRKKNQCNMTALHKEPLCLDISFLLAYFCLECSESLCMPGGEEGGSSSAENNVGIKRHVLSFLCSVSAASSQIISYGNTIHHSRQVTQSAPSTGTLDCGCKTASKYQINEES